MHLFMNMQKNKIDIRYPEKLDTTEELNFIKELKPDVVVVVAYGKIIHLI